jgi:trans-aconitate 2-methyltransferase
MKWDPAVYLSFGDLRLRPGLELIQAVPLDKPNEICDLGCGPGNLTPFLADRWPKANIIGVDNSPEMLAKAHKAASEYEFVEADIANWQPEQPVDLIYSNAALQWLGDHETLFPQLFAQLTSGGVLAVQMPRNHSSPSHTMILETVENGPWSDNLRPLLRHNQVAAPADYYDLMAPLSDHLTIWDVDYLQIMEGENPVADWTRGTALRPFLSALGDDDERAAFESDYRDRIKAAYPKAKDGKTLFPFRRIFILAKKN